MLGLSSAYTKPVLRIQQVLGHSMCVYMPRRDV